MSAYDLHFDLDLKLDDSNGISICERFDEIAKMLTAVLREEIKYPHIIVTPRSFEIDWEEDNHSINVDIGVEAGDS